MTAGVNDSDSQGKKRIAIIAVSSILLVGMVVVIAFSVTLNPEKNSEEPTNGNGNEVTASMKAVKSICHNTEYQKECIRSINQEAGSSSDPKVLIESAFKAAVKKIKKGVEKSDTIQKLEKDPRTKMAIDQCKELAAMSISELQRATEKIPDMDIQEVNKALLDLKTWLSAAYTYQETCLDGFEDTSGDAAKKMKNALKSGMHLTGDGITIVSQMHQALTDFSVSGIVGRRLLADDQDGDGHGVPVLAHNKIHDDLKIDSKARKLLQAQSSSNVVEQADVVVAKDGTGNFTTVGEAVKAIPKKRPPGKTFVIYIREGVYNEQVNISSWMSNLMFIGDGPLKSRITFNKNFKQNITTFRTATVGVSADNFIAKDMGFENSAGPENHQAVALRVTSDMAIFYNCAMDGYQDTLYAHAKRQFYRDCTISGTIDFVFGNALAVLQNCTFVVRKPLNKQACIVTAQGREKPDEPTALVLQGCRFVADPAYQPVKSVNKAYLARPWKEYSRTIIMNSFVDDLIAPEGYLPWNGEFGLKTLVYGEYNNYGPGADTSKRVDWPGVLKSVTSNLVQSFEPSNYLLGDDWITAAGVPYDPSSPSSQTAQAPSGSE